MIDKFFYLFGIAAICLHIIVFVFSDNRTGVMMEKMEMDSGCYSLFYKLEGKEIKKCESESDVIRAFGEDRRIKRTEVSGKIVSTVFLIIDLNFCNNLKESEPVLFETMVFPEQKECIRYCTYDEAIAGHDEIVERIRRKNDN